MVICFRCQVNISEFECEICNGFYCSECDKFIHSKKPKNNHIRKQLKNFREKNIEKNEPKVQLDFKPNLTYDKPDINIINNEKENKKIENEYEQNIISQTYQIDRNYKSNYNNMNNNNEEENFEHPINKEINNNENLNQNMNDCMENINNIMNEEYEYKPDEKDTEIISLQKQIEDQTRIKEL